MTGDNEGIHILKYFFHRKVVIRYGRIDVVHYATAIAGIMAFIASPFGGQ